ncbi:unnamed protein product [Lampetra planeri]
MWKPLVATSSLDHSVRVWNYKTKVLELYKDFQEEVYSVSLHPTGLLVLAGFSNKLRLMSLLLDDIRSLREFSVRGCRERASGNVIHIYSVTSFESLLSLKGHNGKVRAIEWSLDDSRLVTCGMDGAVYQWNMQTGKRESESVLKSCSYSGVAFSSDCGTILAVGSDVTLKEIQDCQVLREVPADDDALTAVVASRSGRVLFTGTSSGAIRAVRYPLPIQKEWITQQAHCGPVTKMVITYDDRFLLTASEDSCLIIWKMVNKDDQEVRSNSQMMHIEEVLITKSDLEEKSQTLLEMKMRLDEIHMENEYQLRLKDISHRERTEEISAQVTQQIEALTETQKVMQAEMEKQQHEHRRSSAEVSMKHSRELEALERSYSQKLIVEHERFQDMQHKCERAEEDLRGRLEAAAESKHRAVEELTQLYEADCRRRRSCWLRSSLEDAQQRSRVFKETVRQTKEDEETLIRKIQIDYERKLYTERQTNAKLQEGADIMTQKSLSLQRQIDDGGADIAQLKQERQRLLDLIGSLERDMEDLKRQICGHERTAQDKDQTISGLKRKNQDLEKLKFVLEFQLNDLKDQTDVIQQEKVTTRERTHQLEEELLQLDKTNTQLKLSISDLKLQRRSRDKEMRTERQRAKDLKIHVDRLKSDLHACAGLIQEPRKLKDSVQMIYARYVQQPVREDESNMEEIQKAFRLQRGLLEKTIASLKTRLAQSAEEHQKIYVKLMKENGTQMTEINGLRRELHQVRSQVKDYKAQLATVKKSSKCLPYSEEGHRPEPSDTVN